MTGVVLILAVACLGGVIATVGDRIGMKVGKSRLSLFNLRPRQTATLVSVVTGMVASFSTLMLLIALDDQLRKGLFQLDDIQEELAAAQTELESTQTAKNEAESSLKESLQLQKEAQSRLSETKKSLQTARAREEETLASLVETQTQLSSVSQQADSLRSEIESLRVERQALADERARVLGQIRQRDDEIAERNQALQQRNQDLAERDSQIAQRDQDIADREARLKELQTQQTFLSQEIARLEDEFRGLRLGDVAIGRNETLAFTVTRTDSPIVARRAVEDALAEANRFAVQTVLSAPASAVENLAIRVDPEAVEEIIGSITDLQNYVIQVSSAANYVQNEPCVEAAIRQGAEPCLQVVIEVALNEVIFQAGDVMASASIEGRDDISNRALFEHFNFLRASAELQARRRGIILAKPIIAGGRTESIGDFFSQVQAYGEPLEVQAFATQPILTTGPVYLDLAAVQNGQVLFSTLDLQQP